MQIVWSWKNNRQSADYQSQYVVIIEIFWIDFSICLNCTLFVDLSAIFNPFLTIHVKILFNLNAILKFLEI